MTENQKLREALQVAEAALSDIGDADREPGDDLAWCERRAAQSLPLIREALALPTATPVGERELFERTMMDKYGWQRDDFKLGYADGQTDTAWMAWQARSAMSAGDAGWQPIETAPMDGRLGLVYRPLAANTRDEPIAIKSLIGGDRFCWPNTAPKGSAPTNPTDGACHVTHWMPLPPAPAMRKDKP